MKTHAPTKTHHHPTTRFWLEKAWPEGAQAMAQLREKAFGEGELDRRTKAFIQLACVSLLRCGHCIDGTVGRLKTEFKATDREIAEVMMVAGYAAAGTNMAWAKEVFERHLESN